MTIDTTVPFRKVGPHTSPAITVQLPCDRCGSKAAPVISIYAAYEQHRKSGSNEGFYPSRSFRLCGECLEAALAILGE